MLPKKRLTTLFLLLILIISACSGQFAQSTNTPHPATQTKTAIPEPTATPEPCDPENIKTEVENIHKLMREFDDASLLASNTPLEQISPVISELQRIRRETEDQRVPACLSSLKGYQLAHMETVINTMLGFLGNADAASINQSIALARQQYDQYTYELASLLGLDLVTATPPDETLQTDIPPATASLTITNPGPSTVNLRAQPNLEAETLGLLNVGVSATVIGRTADALWYQIEVPDQPGNTAWVYASLAEISNPNEEIPVIDTPGP